MAHLKAQKKQKHQQRKRKIIENRKHLANVRVVQHNLVFVVGLPLRLADAEVIEIIFVSSSVCCLRKIRLIVLCLCVCVCVFVCVCVCVGVCVSVFVCLQTVGLFVCLCRDLTVFYQYYCITTFCFQHVVCEHTVFC
jgi:hypothetical protein